MPDRLHWETVKPLLKEALTIIMQEDLFKSFRLVGGTSLSLQRGHRESDDIDIFTDAVYGSVDFDAIDIFLREKFPYVSPIAPGPVGMGRSYLVGNNDMDTVKLDIYYSDPFIQPALEFGIYRLATVEEIIAMKVDVIQRKGRKKDFWDIHEVLSEYSVDQMISLHDQRYPYGHDEQLIRANFIGFEEAEDDFDPKCLRGKRWEFIKLDIARVIVAKIKD